MLVRRVALVLSALTVAGVTALVGRAWLQERNTLAVQQQPVQTAPGIQVLVARGDLPAGQFVRPENLRWQAWPKEGLAGTYLTPDKQKLEDLVGAVVRTGIGDGEPITENRVVRPGDRGFMAAVLTPGMRAIAVPVTATSGVSGFVFPGDRVDLLLTMQVQREEKVNFLHHASETVLRNLRVLAVDQRADDQKKDVLVAKTATLEVTSKQAETIAVIAELGRLSLSLRSLAHDGETEEPKLSHTWDSEATRLLPPPVSPTELPVKVSVVRGGDAKDVEFQKPRR